MQAQKFNRRKFLVDAVQVSEENMEQVATWCEGEIKETNNGVKYVKVNVHRPLNVKHTRAFVGDWISISDQGYKVYTDRAFCNSFELEEPKKDRNVFNDTEELRVTNDPIPADHEETEEAPAPAAPVQNDPPAEAKPTPAKTPREALGFNTPQNIINN